MDKKTTIKNYFEDRLTKISKEVLLGKVSEDAELFSFLNEVGLVSEFDLINFYFEKNKIEVTNFENQDYLIIGDDFGTKICVQLSNNKVYSIDEEGDLPMRFINSSIENLMLFIMVYEQHHEEIIEADDDEIVEIIGEIKSKLNELDSQALSFEENWWAVILEQTEDGLM